MRGALQIRIRSRTVPAMTLSHLCLSLLASLTLPGFAGCVNDDVYNEMTPLKGAGERPSVRNRFPAERGGFQHSRADETEENMTTAERLIGQY